MPIFEFACEHCGWEFEELLRSASAASEVICPACESTEVRRKISTFAARITGGNTFSTSFGSSSSCSTGST